MKEVHVQNIERDRKASIVSIACSFESEINATINGKKYNAKSIMNTIIIDNAQNIDFIVEGIDEDNAVEVIEKFYNHS